MAVFFFFFFTLSLPTSGFVEQRVKLSDWFLVLDLGPFGWLVSLRVKVLLQVLRERTSDLLEGHTGFWVKVVAELGAF